jgi:hypothetical protein
MSTRILHLLATLLAVSHSAATTANATNPKRGLVYVKSPDPWVNSIWFQDDSPLTWYYNYLVEPSEPFAGVQQSDFEFVPMMWGWGPDNLYNPNDTSFLTNVTNLIKNGRNIKHVLGFNQPDVLGANGGSEISPANAAKLWINNFVPLQKMGVKIGLPVIKADWDPTNWTVPFLHNCTELLGGDGNSNETTCPFDFVPIHVFGNMSVITKRVERFIDV